MRFVGLAGAWARAAVRAILFDFGGFSIVAGLGGAHEFVTIVIAVNHLHALAIENDQHVDDAIEEVTVVADDHDRALELAQGVFQRFAGPEVEMIRRLIQDEHIDARGHQPSQARPAAFAAAEFLDRLIDLISRIRPKRPSKSRIFFSSIFGSGNGQTARSTGLSSSNMLKC